MTSGLTVKQRKQIEKTGVIPPEIKAWDPSLHFCPDWDFMLVSKHDPEAEGCTCDLTPKLFHATPDIEKCIDGSEHDFTGWRDFEDGTGGEQVCSKCGIGAMAWSLRVGP